QKELLKRSNAKKDYNDLADEIDRLREQKQNAMAGNAEREGLKQRIAEMKAFLAEQTEQIEEYDESLVRRMVEKVTVYEEKFMVEFKSGVQINIKM
ncbi:MAG: site-specific recombinase, partial [Ignavibacteriales bacterium]